MRSLGRLVLVVGAVGCGPAVGVGAGSDDGSSTAELTSTGVELTSTGVELTSTTGFETSTTGSSGEPAGAEVEGDCSTTIEDPALALYVWEALGLAPGSEIPSETLATLEGIDAWGHGIASVAGLECAVGLRYIAIGPGDNDEPNWITDLSPLAHLPALESLTLWGNPLEDLSPLATVTTLRRLLIRETQVVDLSPLADLPLEDLSANDAPIENVEPLAACTSLVEIGLDRTNVSDLSPLADLPALTGLYVVGTPVSDVSMFSDTGLEALLAAETLVDELPLDMSLRSADFDSNGIVDPSPLLTWQQPHWVDLSNNAIDDITSLSDLTWTGDSLGECVELNLEGNPLRHPDTAAVLQQLCTTLPVLVRADGDLACSSESCLAPP